ncbi:MAG TPA: right-handed parallel beta-helix repeat-containing protein, partial [Pirellulaceae bacterium]|nr:right-handed parallel beta-helix repeat-containing protein [Pirellulaceae bacterium]
QANTAVLTFLNSHQHVWEGFVIRYSVSPPTSDAVRCTDSTVTMRTCEICNCGDGVKVVRSAVTLDNCYVHDNVSNGILTQTTGVTCTQCTISSNSSSGIYTNGSSVSSTTVSLTRCLFTNNGPDNVFVRLATLNLDGGRFEGGTTSGVSIDSAVLTHVNSPVITNNAVGLMITQSNAAQAAQLLEISDLTLTGNTMTGLTSSNTLLKLTNCDFSSNGDTGAAIYNGTINATNCTVTGNPNIGVLYRATSDLFGIGVGATFTSCTFTDNSSYGLVLSGDTISGVDAIDAAVVGCTLRGPNQTTGILANRVDMTLTDCVVQDHPQYGIDCARGNMTFESTSITGSGVTGLSFADDTSLSTPQGSLTIDGCTIDANSQFGVYVVSDPAFGSLNNVTIAGTTVSGSDTAGVYVYLGNVACSNTTFTNLPNIGLYCIDCDLGFTNMPALSNCGVAVALEGGSVSSGSYTLQGLTFSNNSLAGVTSYGCALTLSSCAFDDNGTAGVIAQSGNLTVVDSSFARNGVWQILMQGFDDGVAATNSLIVDHSTLSDCGDVGILALFCNVELRNQCQITGGTFGLQVWNLSDQTGAVMGSTTVSNTEFTNFTVGGISSGFNSVLTLSSTEIRDGQGFGVTSYGDQQTVVERVWIYRNTDVGFSTSGGILNVRNMLLASNKQGMYLSSAQSNLTAEILNTTVADNGTEFGIFVDGGNVTICNTIMSNNGEYGLVRSAGDITHGFNMINGHTADLHGTDRGMSEIFLDPLFVQRASSNYRLTLASRAINRGCDAITVTSDIDGLGRPCYGRWEIGAYEYPQAVGVRFVDQWLEVR